MSSIRFFAEDLDYHLDNEAKITTWLTQVITAHNFKLDVINYIFCSDEYLLTINKSYLNHDYYTDIITFDNSSEKDCILADIFISIERVQENALDQNVDSTLELHRVIIHGLLHLLGYNDKSQDDQLIMQQKEDACLSLLKI